MKYHPRVEWLSRRHEEKLYSEANESSQMDVSEVAQVLQEVGITPKTVFIAWHNNRYDLRLFRNFLEEGGYKGILPGDDNCIPMVPYFRRNIPKELSLSLPIIFEALYPGHKLIGHNHRALPDCQQTMLVLDAFEQLCKPPEKQELGWRIETLQDLYTPVDSQQTEQQIEQQDAQQVASVSFKRKASLTGQSIGGPSRPKRARLSPKL